MLVLYSRSFSSSQALTHFKFDATMLSLDDVCNGLRHDRETYYFLWVAVRKVLEEAPGVKKYRYFLIKHGPRACGIALNADGDT